MINVKDVKRFAAEGFSQSSIATMLGCTREYIRQVCNKHSIECLTGRPDHDRRDALLAAVLRGEHLAQAARSAGYDYSSARNAIKAIGIKPVPAPQKTSPKADEIARLIGEGYACIEIAKTLGCQKSTVSRVKADRGLTFLRDGRRIYAASRAEHIEAQA